MKKKHLIKNKAGAAKWLKEVNSASRLQEQTARKCSPVSTWQHNNNNLQVKGRWTGNLVSWCFPSSKKRSVWAVSVYLLVLSFLEVWLLNTWHHGNLAEHSTWQTAVYFTRFQCLSCSTTTSVPFTWRTKGSDSVGRAGRPNSWIDLRLESQLSKCQRVLEQDTEPWTIIKSSVSASAWMDECETQ